MMPVEVTAEDLIRLELMDPFETSCKKVGKRLVAQKIVESFRAATGLFMLGKQSDGACVFLNVKTRLCAVYEKRPGVCRKFPEAMGIRLGFCPFKEKKWALEFIS